MGPESEKYISKSGKGIAGGSVSNEPFPRALYELSRSRGYVSQMSLARELGCQHSIIVSKWYRGESAPTLEYFSALLRLLKPNDKELEDLVNPYCELFTKGFGSQGRVSGTERSFKVAKKERKPASNLFGRTIDKICDRERITFRKFAQKIGILPASLQTLRRKRAGSLELLAEILEKVSQSFELKEDEIIGLSEGVAQMIEEKVRKGERLMLVTSTRYRSLQKEIPCQTYRPVNIANELGLSRERVRQIRQKLGIENVIMTEEDRQQILDYRKKVRAKTS